MVAELQAAGLLAQHEHAVDVGLDELARGLDRRVGHGLANDLRDREERRARAVRHASSDENARILSHRGDAILLEPEEMREALAIRARELATELGVSRLRVRA